MDGGCHTSAATAKSREGCRTCQPLFVGATGNLSKRKKKKLKKSWTQHVTRHKVHWGIFYNIVSVFNILMAVFPQLKIIQCWDLLRCIINTRISQSILFSAAIAFTDVISRKPKKRKLMMSVRAALPRESGSSAGCH